MDINIETRTPEEIDKLKLWVTRYLASEAYCTDFFDAGRANYNLYKSYIEKSDKVYKHSIFVPYSFAYMEDRVAYFMLSVLASPVTYSLLPRHHSITRELCMELEQVVHWVLTEENTEFVLELEEIIKNTCIFNAGYMITYPLTKEKLVPSLLEPGQRIPKTVFDRLHLDVPSTLDVYPEPKIKRFSRMNWVIKKSWEDFDTLKSLEGKPGGYENVDLAKGGFTEDDPITQMLHGIGLNTDVPYYDKGRNRIELLDCLFDGNVITIGGRKAIIRDTSKQEIRPFSFKFPMLDCRTTGAPGEFFGVDLIESMKPSQLDLNSLRSQRRDNVSLLLNKLFIYDFMAGEVDLNTFFSAPGNVIMTSNRDAIDEFPISDVTSSSYKEEEALLYDLQSISAMWNYARGATPRRRETATGIIRLQQAAQARNEWILRKLDAYILQPLCRRIMVYLMENLSREDYAGIVGSPNHAGEFFSLGPEEIKKFFGIMPMTESIVSVKEIDTNQFLQSFDRLIQMPEVNRPELIKQLLQKLGQKDVKAILPMLSPAGQEGFVTGVREGTERPPALPGMGGPDFGSMAKQV